MDNGWYNEEQRKPIQNSENNDAQELRSSPVRAIKPYPFYTGSASGAHPDG